MEKLVAEWVVPGRRLKYDYLCSPTRALGLQQPLQDVYKSNVALVLRGQTNLPLLDEEKAADTDPGSMLISDHTRRAVALYTHLVGSPPPNDTERKSLYSAMADADETVLYELKCNYKEAHLGVSEILPRPWIWRKSSWQTPNCFLPTCLLDSETTFFCSCTTPCPLKLALDGTLLPLRCANSVEEGRRI